VDVSRKRYHTADTSPRGLSRMIPEVTVCLVPFALSVTSCLGLSHSAITRHSLTIDVSVRSH